MAFSDQHFEDELREKLSKDAPLPPGMEWEAMRQGIHQKVNAERKAKRPFLAWWRPVIGIALLLLAGLTGYLLRPVVSAPLETPLTGEIVATDLSTSQGSSAADATGLSSEDHTSGRVTPPPTEELQRPGGSPPAVGRPPKAAGRVPLSLQDDGTPVPKGTTGTEAVPPTTLVTGSATSPEQVTLPTNPHSVDEALAILPFRSYSFMAEGNFLSLPQAEGIKQEENAAGASGAESGQKGWFIDVLAGTQFASATYQGDDAAYAALRSETETPLPGHHLSVGIGKKIGKASHIRTGLAYDRMRTLTDYTNMRTFDSTFLNYPVRAINGDTIYGAADVSVREDRELKSFQREQRLTVPLLIGRNFRLGSNWLALRAGPEFGLLIGSGGKVLAADGSVRYLSDADFQKLSISARLEGELAVPLGKNGPLLIGRIGLRRVLGGGPAEVQRTGNSVVGGIGVRERL